MQRIEQGRIGRLPTGTTAEELGPPRKEETLPVAASLMPSTQISRLMVPPRSEGGLGQEEHVVSPYRQTPDVVALGHAIERSKSPASRRIDELLKQPLEGIPKERNALLNGSVILEQRMLAKLEPVLTMLRDVYAKMAQTQEG